MKTLRINHLAVLACVVAGQIIPALWYTIFSDPWIVLSDLSMDQIESTTSVVPYLASIIATGLAVYTIAWIFTRIPIESAQRGLLTGLLLGTVFVLAETIVKDMFSYKAFALSLINGGASVVVYTISGLILGAWRRYGSYP